MRRRRLAIVVSHPIQYYVPLYRRLAARGDLSLKVFFTWHAGGRAVRDHGFRQPVAWDIPLAEGFEHELVPNVARDPGTHRFFGLRNPALADRVLAWNPDAVHVTGWAWYSNLVALHAFARRGVPILFRGDSHLLDSPRAGLRTMVKRALLHEVFRWPRAFLYVGTANRRYYETFGVEAERLFPCPHSIDVDRFARAAEPHEQEARTWRRDLGIADDRIAVLYAGKFEPKKQPLRLMKSVGTLEDPRFVLIMAGAGELERQVAELAAAAPERFRVLPFQNQSRMPVLYRLADVCVLPSAHGETWGLAVNEAMACGRPVIVSDRVGCAEDLVDSTCGRVFPFDDFHAFSDTLVDLTRDRPRLAAMRAAAAQMAAAFDVRRTEETLVACFRHLFR